MARVKGPNGLVFDLPDTIASGLVDGDNEGYEYADTPKPAPEQEAKPAPKRRPRTPRATQK